MGEGEFQGVDLGAGVSVIVGFITDWLE